eukprot:9741-Chlamydomonas_euryale.AAC.2
MCEGKAWSVRGRLLCGLAVVHALRGQPLGEVVVEDICNALVRTSAKAGAPFEASDIARVARCANQIQ